MSPGPGDDPFGEGDPFKGVPIFGDLARMFQGQGPVSWDAARQLALSIATGGQPESNVDPADRIRLEQIARVAELHVANATGLDTSHTGRGITVVAVTRGQWAQKTLSAYAPLIERLAGSLADTPEADEPTEPDLSTDLGGGDPMAWMAPLMKMVGPMMLGMTAGSMVGHLATRTFGQYDLPLPRAQADELMVVPANLDAFGQDWSLPADDLRLWVCLHEIAHHAVLGVPHVRQRLEGLLARYAEGFEPNPESLEHRLGGLEVSDPANLDIGSLLSDPEIMLGAVRSPGQHELVPQIEALVATIAGYVDHVMDQVGNGLIGNYGMLSEALRRRRVEASQADRFVEQLFGVELTQAQYERGERFVAGVVERAGAEGLGRLWESAETLPTPAEVDAPGLWLARIELPTD